MAQVLHYEMTCDGTCRRAMQLPKISVPLLAGLEWVVRNVVQWNQRSRQRQALADLDDHLLKDVGITRSAAIAEISRPLWR
jgi:uncharacterized protein YjiS (DUF1127 family)